MAATQIKTRQIADLAVTTAKLAATSVTFAKMAVDSIGIDQIKKSPDFTLTKNLSGLEGFGPTGKEIRVKPGAGIGIASDESGVYTTAIVTVTSPNGSLIVNLTPNIDSYTSATVESFGPNPLSSDPTAVANRAWMNTTASSPRIYLPSQTKVRQGGVLTVASSTSTAVANTTTETNFSNGSVTINAGDVGGERVLRLTAWGTYNSTGTPNLQFRVKIDGANAAQGGNLTVVGTASGRIWHVDAMLVVKATGVSGTLESRIASGVDNGIINQRQGTQAIDTTIAHTFNLSAAWSAASASNSVTCLGAVWEMVS